MPSFRALLRHLFVAPLAAVFVSGAAVAASVDIVDDQGQALRLAQPARRIVSLAPHITELLYAAGAGEPMTLPQTRRQFWADFQRYGLAYVIEKYA